MDIEKIAKLAKPIISLGNQYGEGWLLTGEMAELIRSACLISFAYSRLHVCLTMSSERALSRLLKSSTLKRISLPLTMTRERPR